MRFGAVILAGGRSTRMGRDKALLPCRGITLLECQLALVRALGPAEILVSGRPGAGYGAPGLPVVLDRFAGLGPLAGVESALAATSCPLLLVLAVDLPDMTGDFLRRLLARCRGPAGVVPRTSGGLEPLAAVYPRALHPVAEALLREGRPAMTGLIQRGIETGLLEEYACPPDDEPLFRNWNEPGAAEG